MKTLISIDPGMSTGIVVGTYSDTEPYRMTHYFQIEEGVEGFLAGVRVYPGSDTWGDAYHTLKIKDTRFDLYSEEVVLLHEGGAVCDDGECSCFKVKSNVADVIVEKFTARGEGNNFAYRTEALEPLRVEGAILALGIKPTWVYPAQQYFASGTSKSSVTNAHRWLKEHGLHVTGKDVGCKDANDVRSAILHSIAYLRKIKHLPTIRHYFPKEVGDE